MESRTARMDPMKKDVGVGAMQVCLTFELREKV